MNNHPKKLVEQLEAAKKMLRALEESLAKTQKMIKETRKIIDEAKVAATDDEPADDGKP